MNDQIQQKSLEIAGLLAKTLSPDHNLRKSAEEAILKLELSCPFYGTAALYLVRRPDVDDLVRISASIAFKNFIRRHWRYDPNDESSDQVDRIDSQQRALIKEHLTPIMLEASKHVQRQLSESITIIGQSDFPDNWPSLITELETYLKRNRDLDFTVLHGVLQTAHSIFRRYRHELQSERLWSEIKLVLTHFAQPLTDRFKDLMNATKLEAVFRDEKILTPVFQSLLLCVKIYHSLIIQDLPEFFEDHLGDWLPNFLELLDSKIVLRKETGLVEDLKSEICEIAGLFVQRYSDINNFQEYTQRFAESIWKLLTSTSQDLQFDTLVSNAIRYLVTVAERHETQSLFKDKNVLDSLCQKVIIPNMELREADIELFEDNPDEYVKKDIEGSDVDTRRRAAFDLVQALSKFLENELISIFSRYMNEMFRVYSENRSKNWKHKDLALFLFSSMAVKQSTRQHGTVLVSSYVNIEDFLKNNILNELTSEETFEGSSILKSDALRYVTTFRNNISVPNMAQLLPAITKLITSNDVVVRTYASICLEKILTLKRTTQSKENAFKPEDFEPHLSELINTLFKALELPGSPENEYIMKAIMRLFSFSKSNSLIQYLPVVVPKITQKLALIAKNPSRPNFNHYLFETLALTVRAACIQNSSAMNDFEAVLFNILEAVIAQDIQEFVPYVLQILNIILNSHPVNNIPVRFTKLFSELLSPALWEKPANVHPLTELMHSYVEKIGRMIVSQQKLEPLLGIFQKLIASKATDNEGLALLKTMIIHLPAASLDAHIQQVFYLLFQRLSGSKTTKFVRNLLPCFSLYAYVRGPDVFASAVNKLQDRMFGMLIEKVYIPEVKKVTDPIDRKICIGGLMKIISQLPLIDSGAYDHLWGPLLHVLMEILELPLEIVDDEEEHLIEIDEIASSFQAQFSRLTYASKKRIDPLNDLTDLKTALALSLSNLSTKLPGFIPRAMKHQVTPAVASCLSNYCIKANVNLL